MGTLHRIFPQSHNTIVKMLGQPTLVALDIVTTRITRIVYGNGVDNIANARVALEFGRAVIRYTIRKRQEGKASR